MSDSPLQSLAETQNTSNRPGRNRDRSSRTTFSISEEAVQALSWLADYYETSQKQVVDHVLHILEDMKATQDSLTEATETLSVESEVRKSVAIAPNTREGLNELADDLGVARDRLVEVGIRLSKLVAEKHLEKKRTLLEEVREYFDRGLAIEKRISKKLGHDDSLHRCFGEVVSLLQQHISDEESLLEAKN